MDMSPPAKAGAYMEVVSWYSGGYVALLAKVGLEFLR